MTPEERKASARKAATARWKKPAEDSKGRRVEERRARLERLRAKAAALRLEYEGIRFEHEAGALTRDERIVLSRPIISEMNQVIAEIRALVPTMSNPTPHDSN